MAVSTDIKTPLTLVKDQQLSILATKSTIACWNNSSLSELHYRSIPNDGNAQWNIYWANLPSVLQNDGDYAIAVTMYEYYPDYRDVTNLLRDAKESGLLIDVPERGRMVIAKNPFVYEENRHIVFRKIVWVQATDLIMGSPAQQKAIADAEAEKQRKYIESLTTATTPTTGNTVAPKASSTIWIILGVFLLIIGGVWALISGAKKKRAIAEAEKKTGNGSNVNIIRIPKNS